MSLIDPTKIDDIKEWWDALPNTRQTEILAGVLMVVIILGATILWAYSGQGPSKKEANVKANIAVANGENAVIQNLAVNAEKAVNEAENNSNRAVNDLRNTINIPSNKFDGNRANDHFCRDFPGDPSCQPKPR